MTRMIRVTEGYSVRAQDIEAGDIVSFDGGSVWNYAAEVNVIKSEARPWSVVEVDYVRPSIINRHDGPGTIVQPYAKTVTLSGMALVLRQVDKIVRVADM